jgi:AcrR family transcriptional regulator
VNIPEDAKNMQKEQRIILKKSEPMTATEKQRVSRKHKIPSHAEKTAQTRARLLESAEKIFARDGFEAAKLEEIASDAGYTRGAFYANFDSKEDLFIALLAEEVDKRMALARQRTAQRAMLSLSKEQLLPIVRHNYIHSLKNRTWNILFLEYKLFVLRHPELRPKVTEMQARAYSTVASALEAIFAGIEMKPPVPALAAGTALASLANTLGLDLAVGKAITEEEADKVLGLLFDALLT